MDVQMKSNIYNPWDVSDVSQFLKYCCPECECSHANFASFKDHAVQEHPQSSSLFRKSTSNGAADRTGMSPHKRPKTDAKREYERWLLGISESIDLAIKEPTKPNNATFLATSSDDLDKDKRLKMLDSVAKQTAVKDDPDDYETNPDSTDPLYTPELDSDFRKKETKNTKQLTNLLLDVKIPDSMAKGGIKSITNSRGTHYMCEECGKTCGKDKAFLLRHWLRYHASEKSNNRMCQECSEIHATIDSLLDHYTQKHPWARKPFFRCDSCEKVTKNRSDMIQHCKEEHKTEYKPYKCPACPLKFRFRSKIRNHYVIHHGDGEPQVCETCGKHLNGRKAMQHHIKAVHKVDRTQRNFMCTKCGYATYSQKLLRIHIVAKHEKHLHHKCKFCDETFPIKTGLNYHLDRVHAHMEGGRLKCEKCKLYFYSTRGLNDHYCGTTDVKAAPEKPKCEICKEFMPNTAVQKHFEKHHPGVRPVLENRQLVPCNHCNMAFLSRMNLVRHVSLVHNVHSKPHTCPDCHMGYTLIHNCRKSVRKKWACDRCPAVYTNKPAHDAHVKSVHLNQLDYKCERCGKLFATSGRLDNHMKMSHSPTSCDICNKTILNTWELKRHKAFVHQVLEKGDVLCELCPRKLFTDRRCYHEHMVSKHGYSETSETS